MKNKIWPHLFLSAFALSSCTLKTSPGSKTASTEGNSSTSGTASSSSKTDSVASSEDGSSSTVISSLSQDSPSYEDFWAYGAATDIHLSFTNAALYALSDYGYNYDEKYADVYFPATFTATLAGKTYTYEEVGVRMKGNNSREIICSSDGTITGVCHFKVSFKCTFDDAIYSQSAFQAFQHTWSDSALRKTRKARRFADMARLDLKYLPRNASGSSYVTYSQDIYCYDVFAQEGIASPKAKWANLVFNDDKSSKSSSYEAVEAMDDCFITHHFPSDAGGDLYKCSTYKDDSGSYVKADLTTSGAVSSSGSRVALGKIGVEDCLSLYHPNYQLKTNDDGENSDFSKMANFIVTVNSVKSGKSPQNSLESVLDTTEFLEMEAVSYCLGNFDDQRNNYNNYFIYFRPSDSKAVYIPYDWDWSLGATTGSSSIASWKPYHTSTTHDSSNTNPLYWCTILSNSSLQYSISAYRSTYANKIKKVVSDGYLSSNTYSTFVEGLANAVTKELSSVASYMASKTSVIASSL